MRIKMSQSVSLRDGAFPSKQSPANKETPALDACTQAPPGSAVLILRPVATHCPFNDQRVLIPSYLVLENYLLSVDGTLRHLSVRFSLLQRFHSETRV